MSNIDFYDSNIFYLVDIFNGKLTKSKINFKIVNNSIYNLKNAKQVEVESAVKKIDSKTGEEYYEKVKHIAFVKCSNNNYSDELDIINSEMAALLGIPASKVFRLDNDKGQKGVINIDVKKANEQQISIDALFKKIINMLNSKKLGNLEWLSNYHKIPENNEKLSISDHEIIKLVIDMFMNIMGLFFKLNNNDKDELKKNYIQMIFFDLLSFNTYRGFNSYSILLDGKGKFSRLAPIYDYNNNIGSNDYYNLNGVFIKRNAIIECLYKYYYKYIKNISRGLVENIRSYVESADLIIDSNLNNEEASVIKNNYHVAFEGIKSFELLRQDDYGENKLDIAVTKTSINLNAINNNQRVHQKYDKYEKETTVSDLEDTIKIKVEPKKKSSVGKNVALFILGLIVLCGIAVGITYFIISYYN